MPASTLLRLVLGATLVLPVQLPAQDAPRELPAPVARALASPGDRGAMRAAFATDADTASMAMLARLHVEGGALTPVSVEALGPLLRVIVVRATRAPREATLFSRLDERDPTRLARLDFIVSRPLVLSQLTWPDRPLASRRAIADVIMRNLDRLERDSAFSGVVRVMHGDRVLVERAMGFADREHGVRNHPHTRFTIASIGKMFTGVAIAQLIESGRLRLDDTLAQLLPDYPNRERAARITVRHLLAHEAGTGMLFDDPRVASLAEDAGPMEIAAAVAAAPLAFEPGSRAHYSNEGFVILAAIVERASGIPFERYLAEHVFARAGMTRTMFAGRDDVVPDRAIGYRPQEGDLLRRLPPRANWSFLKGRGNGAGGQYTTAADLSAFLAAYRDGRLMSPALRDTMLIPRRGAGTPTPQSFGYGMLVSQVHDRVVFGHGGGGAGSGIDNDVRTFADGSWTVIVVSNDDPPVPNALSSALVNFLARQHVTLTTAR